MYICGTGRGPGYDMTDRPQTPRIVTGKNTAQTYSRRQHGEKRHAWACRSPFLRYTARSLPTKAVAMIRNWCTQQRHYVCWCVMADTNFNDQLVSHRQCGSHRFGEDWLVHTGAAQAWCWGARDERCTAMLTDQDRSCNAGWFASLFKAFKAVP